MRSKIKYQRTPDHIVLKKGEHYCGAVTQSDFEARCRFIEKRIKLGYSREEISFLLGKNPYLIKTYEEMAARIKPDATDIETLASIFKEDMSFLHKTDECDYSRKIVKGIKTKTKDTITYEINPPWSKKKDNLFKITESSTDNVLTEQSELIRFLASQVGVLLQSGYFNNTRSALQIFNYEHQYVSSSVRPLFVKNVLYHYLQEKQLVCFRDKNGRFWYHGRTEKQRVFIHL